MKLRPYPTSLLGNRIERDQFGFVLKAGQGLNPEGIDTIHFWCRGGKHRICAVDVTLGPAGEVDGRRRWHWDGNMETPTLVPSIGCDAKCGWHGHILNGEILP